MKWALYTIFVACGFNALMLCCLLMTPRLTQAQSPGYLEVGRFSSANIAETLPPGWEPLTFSKIERHTDYSLVKADNTVVVKAVSNQSASGLTRAVSIAPARYPVIQWQWKVDNILQKGDVTSKDGDDYAARIYITFALDPERAGYLERLKHEAARVIFGQDVPYRAISYIWASNTPAGAMVANPYTDRVMMIAVEGGDEKAGQWVTEKRNIQEDYKQAFGAEPAMISGIAIMTDTDNTRESAIAWYGDIIFTNDPAGLN
ncbi:MAG: DUF3047 domain-containing protein [Gammaproteobacteria bacterium]